MSRAEASGFDEKIPNNTSDMGESSEQPQYMIILDKLLAYNQDTIAAIDPGGTSGLAWVYPVCAHIGDIRTADMDERLLCSWMRLMMMVHYGSHIDYDAVLQSIGVPDLPIHPSMIIIESWRLYKASARTFINSDMPTAQLVGRIREVADLLGIPVVLQAASQMLSVPWAKLGTNDHQHDAGKHLVRYLLDRSATAGRIVM